MTLFTPLKLLCLLFFMACQPVREDDASKATNQIKKHGSPTIVIHGGAGTIKKENMSPEKEVAYKSKLQEALNHGYAILQQGGTSLDAVTKVIQIMEASPLFNAGKGAVFTNEGKNELDASIMDGATGQAGAVAGVTVIKSPILAALAVMKKSPHVMMAGKGAEKFAKEQGLEIVDPSYFYEENRYKQLKRVKERDEKTSYLEKYPDYKFGTVGCVALDSFGNIAAGTSTGGMTNKRYGRIGDSPIIGAGTYADNNTCGVSGTGHGEYFIRNVVAYDIAALMKYKGMSVQEAANEVVMNKLVEKGGDGGVIALDQQGNIAMPFNTAGMFRGYIREKDKPVVLMYKD